MSKIGFTIAMASAIFSMFMFGMGYNLGNNQCIEAFKQAFITKTP